ncbi:MAG TPA: Hsp20/alpha crystallin family protein [Burkholderiales bacterium]|jgi:HSP20 family protein
MANIARYNPFDELFNEFSKGFFVRPFAGMPETAEPKMKLDVKEDEKAYTVRADIPGVKKEDIQVDIDANAVTVRAEVKQEKEEKKDEKVIYSERSYGMVSRSFSLPAEVDAGGAKAEYKDGVLNLVLPKKAGAQARRLQVS